MFGRIFRGLWYILSRLLTFALAMIGLFAVVAWLFGGAEGMTLFGYTLTVTLEKLPEWAQ